MQSSIRVRSHRPRRRFLPLDCNVVPDARIDFRSISGLKPRASRLLLLSCRELREDVMKACSVLLALVATALPLCASDCKPAVNSKGLVSARGTVEQSADVCPLTVGEKGTLFLRHTWSPFNLFAAAGDAAIW